MTDDVSLIHRRVSPLERFRASDDVADPLYGSIDEDGREAAALADTVAHLTHACGGLLDYLLQLQRRCVDFARLLCPSFMWVERFHRALRASFAT